MHTWADPIPCASRRALHTGTYLPGPSTPRAPRYPLMNTEALWHSAHTFNTSVPGTLSFTLGPRAPTAAGGASAARLQTPRAPPAPRPPRPGPSPSPGGRPPRRCPAPAAPRRPGPRPAARPPAHLAQRRPRSPRTGAHPGTPRTPLPQRAQRHCSSATSQGRASPGARALGADSPPCALKPAMAPLGYLLVLCSLKQALSSYPIWW